MKTIITKEKKPWLWQIKSGRKIIAGGYCRTKSDAKNDAAIWRDAHAMQPNDRTELPPPDTTVASNKNVQIKT